MMNRIKKSTTIYNIALRSLFYSLLLSIPIAIIIILIFSYLYYRGSLDSSFYNCTIFSAETFFSLPHATEYTLKSLCGFFASVEALLYNVFFLILIGVLLDQINEDTKNKRLTPIENTAYSEFKRESITLKYNVTLLLFGFTSFILDPDSDRTRSEQIDDEYNKIDYTDDSIKNDIENSEVEKRISNNWGILFESSANKFSVFQIKYQAYIDPDITKKIVEIQNYLNWAVQDIRIYQKKTGLQKNEEIIQEIIDNILRAAKLTQEVIERLDDLGSNSL